ncbi:hypothetical protein TeGR_g6418 [Tetraparma gracilis]|uniref:Flagellar associated protein n=1 Tax=Tetraparma gracilis TaxID=2962635 RepID=A0ABQ6MY71_9STRA|nr:hypothetical protein TeGR_g6418 [Tetraparma gracilis]
MPARTHTGQDAVSENILWSKLIKKENATAPTPNFFREQAKSLSDNIAPKITSQDPRHLSDGVHGMNDQQKARFIKIRQDLERSKKILPVQAYDMAKTRSMEYGWSITSPLDNTVGMRRNEREYSHPRRTSAITTFATNYAKVQGVSPFQRDRHTKKDQR